jgi:hypothetical protein
MGCSISGSIVSKVHIPNASVRASICLRDASFYLASVTDKSLAARHCARFGRRQGLQTEFTLVPAPFLEVDSARFFLNLEISRAGQERLVSFE